MDSINVAVAGSLICGLAALFISKNLLLSLVVMYFALKVFAYIIHTTK